MVLVKLYLIT